MTTSQARNYGCKKILIATTVVFGIWGFLLLLLSIGDRVATSLFSFVDTVLTLHLLIITVILFGLSTYFGGKASVEVMIEKKNTLVVGLKYAVLIALGVSIYASFIAYLREKDVHPFELGEILLKGFAGLFFRMMVSLIVVWGWGIGGMIGKRDKIV